MVYWIQIHIRYRNAFRFLFRYCKKFRFRLLFHYIALLKFWLRFWCRTTSGRGRRSGRSRSGGSGRRSAGSRSGYAGTYSPWYIIMVRYCFSLVFRLRFRIRKGPVSYSFELLNPDPGVKMIFFIFFHTFFFQEKCICTLSCHLSEYQVVNS